MLLINFYYYFSNLDDILNPSKNRHIPINSSYKLYCKTKIFLINNIIDDNEKCNYHINSIFTFLNKYDINFDIKQLYY